MSKSEVEGLPLLKPGESKEALVPGLAAVTTLCFNGVCQPAQVAGDLVSTLVGILLHWISDSRLTKCPDKGAAREGQCGP